MPFFSGASKITTDGAADALPASATYKFPLESTATPVGVVSPFVSVIVGVRLLENGVGVGVGDGVALGLPVGVGVGDGVGVGVGDAVGDPVGVGDGVGSA